MGRGVAERACPARSEAASMGLGIVLQQFETIFPADFADFLGVGAATVEVHKQNRTSALGDGGFDFRVVDFEGVESKLNKYGLQVFLRKRQNRPRDGLPSVLF